MLRKAQLVTETPEKGRDTTLQNADTHSAPPFLGASEAPETPLAAAEGRFRRLAAAPGGRAGVLAAVGDFMRGRDAQAEGRRGPQRADR